MYELIDVEENDATRFLKLRNMNTGIIEECFDDSAVVSENNFGFMQKGQRYACKIKLLGKPPAEGKGDGILCNVLNKETIIGKKEMVEVQINNGSYYIPKQKVSEYLDSDSFHFCFTRKDLVQVNNIVHADLL